MISMMNERLKNTLGVVRLGARGVFSYSEPLKVLEEEETPLFTVKDSSPDPIIFTLVILKRYSIGFQELTFRETLKI